MPATGPASRPILLRRALFPFIGLPLPLMLLALLVSGCSLHRVNLSPAPAKGAASAPALADSPSTDAAPWWNALDEAPLDQLVRRALDENFDVAAARERLERALAARRQVGADFFPQAEVFYGIDHEVYAKGRPRQTGSRRGPGASIDWEPDLFGRQRNAYRARGATAWARRHDVDQFRLTLSSDVAETYYGIIEQRRLLRLLDEQMGTANELLRIINQRYTEGLISNLDVLQQQSQVAELESQIPAAKASLQDLQHRLGALLAALPGDAAAFAAGADRDFPAIGEFPRLERADELLRLRPDLRSAQATLVAADAETGRALAERLPALTLSADALRVSGSGSTVTTVDLGAEIVQPLLDWGARRQAWVGARAEYRERLNTYTQAYLRAAWEVNALIQNEARQRELLESLSRRRTLLESLIRQARSRYDSGLTDYLPVLSATQQLYSVEQRLVRERRRLTSLRISLHRALGGPVPP